jgi:hypothetical protein
MFHTKKPSLGFSKLYQVIVVVVVCGDIPKSKALMLGVIILLVMAKNIGGLRPIIVGEVFLYLLVVPLSYNFDNHFKAHIPLSVWNINP